AGVGALEFITGFFAPEQWENNWWLLSVVILTAVQAILLFLAIYYSKKA
ncbi:MAG: transporter, partial [Prevotella salivae]|nr:transporter [Segatella salivae]